MSSSNEIKFLQLNMFIRPPIVLKNEYRDERVDYLIKSVLPKYDILALQECFGFWTNRRQRIVSAAKRLGYQSAYTRLKDRMKWLLTHQQLKFVDGGLLVLSKYAIDSSEFKPFMSSSNSDSLAMKGVLYTLLDFANKSKVHLFTAHTQASYRFNPTAKSRRIRLEQLAELQKFIKMKTANTPKEWPIIVTGDFNMDALSGDCPEYNEILKLLGMCTRMTDQGSTRFVDVIKEKFGRHVPTVCPYEFSRSSGTELRSSFYSKDFGEVTAGLNDQTLSHTSRNHIEGADTFWCDQRLDYTFIEHGNGAHILDSSVEHFQFQTKPYSHLSDHFGTCITFELLPMEPQ